MTQDINMLRRRFASTVLPGAIYGDPAPFYAAFEESEDAVAAYLTTLWEREAPLAKYPFFAEVIPFVLEDTEEGFSALTLIRLPETATAAELYMAVVFGSDMDPRVFAALPVTLPKGESLHIVECREEGVRDIAALYQGCDNALELFDPPSPMRVDKTAPLPKPRRPHAIVDAVVCWCLDHD